jgi:integrase/recombinase XerD
MLGDALLLRYADALLARGYSEQTLRSRRKHLRRYLGFLGERGLDPLRVTPAVLEDWRLELARTPTLAGLPRRAGTLCNLLVAVKHFYRVLCEADVLCHNPARRLALVRVPPRLPPPVLSIDEAAFFLESIDPTTPMGARDRAALELCYATGMRAGELLSLDVEDLDLSDRLCRIRHGKGGKQRVVPFGPEAARQIENYLRWVRPALLRGRATRALFLSPRGHRVRYAKLRLRLLLHVGAARLGKRLTLHGLRHACATHLIERHAEIRHVQELLGHASVETTQIYTHLSVRHLKEMLHRCHPRERVGEGVEASADPAPLASPSTACPPSTSGA